MVSFFQDIRHSFNETNLSEPVFLPEKRHTFM